MGRDLSNIYVSQSYQYLVQVSESKFTDGLGNEINIPIDLDVVSSSYATTASYVLNSGTNVDTGSFVTTSSFNAYTSSINTATGSFITTASVNLNTITFTKGNGTTFPITVNTGSGGGGGSTFPFTGSALITGSLGITGSLSITGSINLNSGSINNLATPALPADAATKAYVDEQIATINIIDMFGAYKIFEYDEVGTTSYLGETKATNNAWLITRYVESSGDITANYANVSNNATYTTPSTAWAARASLNYTGSIANLSGL
jgi:hypothetical protein